MWLKLAPDRHPPNTSHLTVEIFTLTQKIKPSVLSQILYITTLFCVCLPVGQFLPGFLDRHVLHTQPVKEIDSILPL